ncbi:hypothetical protein KBZ10_00005, partial [Streptomyces sp. F63]|uniref:hypothetical protein n=1 Tax=Streptomyces sp. F63 TaxID=2824887 RepID=UPI001B369545
MPKVNARYVDTPSGRQVDSIAAGCGSFESPPAGRFGDGAGGIYYSEDAVRGPDYSSGRAAL